MGKRLYNTFNDALDVHIVLIPEISCWVWSGASCVGYGVIHKGRKMVKAHRAMYERCKGAIPDGMLVCHKCDNRWCVNPDHLFLGTPLDNMQDKVNKNRQSKGPSHAESFKRSGKYEANRPRGERHGMSKLSDHQRLEILTMLDDGWMQKDVAKEFCVTQSNISFIHRKWRGSNNVSK